MWPSPARFLASSAQTLARVLRGGELVMGRGLDSLVGVVEGVDLKALVRDLTFNTEVIKSRVRKHVINLGRGRKTPTFSGTTHYITYTNKPSLLKALINTANTYGVGKNRPLGLGYVITEVVSEVQLPHKSRTRSTA